MIDLVGAGNGKFLFGQSVLEGEGGVAVQLQFLLLMADLVVFSVELPGVVEMEDAVLLDFQLFLLDEFF